jgi:hypothetical protein
MYLLLPFAPGEMDGTASKSGEVAAWPGEKSRLWAARILKCEEGMGMGGTVQFAVSLKPKSSFWFSGD